MKGFLQEWWVGVASLSGRRRVGYDNEVMECEMRCRALSIAFAMHSVKESSRGPWKCASHDFSNSVYGPSIISAPRVHEKQYVEVSVLPHKAILFVDPILQDSPSAVLMFPSVSSI
jgi:hypothetical protein